jgi:ribonuclease P protein component
MLPRTARLRSSSDFIRVYGRGFSVAGRHMVVYILPGGGSGRLGLSVSRKVGSAVIRNRTRRRLSEAYAARSKSGSTSADVIIIARRPAARASYQIMERELDGLLSEAAKPKNKETGS